MKSVRKNLEVILTRTDDHLGIEGDLIRVRTGFARNWLIPRGLAVLANQANRQLFERSKQRRQSKLQKEKNEYETRAKQITGKSLTLKVRVSEAGKLYGAVTSQVIAERILAEFGYSIPKRKIMIEKPIKELGRFQVKLNPYPGVNEVMAIEVIKDDSVAVAAGTDEPRRGRKKKRLEDLVLMPGALTASTVETDEAHSSPTSSDEEE